MKTLYKAIQDLENIVEAGVAGLNLPVVKGRAIRIGKVIIRESKSLGYLIVDTAENKTVATAYSKHGAVAIANAYLKNITINSLVHQDQVIEKNVNDSVFYHAGLQNCKDPFKKYVLQDRLEIAKQNIDVAKSHLDRFIFDNIR